MVQRLVSLGISAFNLNEQIPENLRGQVGEIYDWTIEVTDDLRKLSRSLHPTVLRYVGLVQAIRSVCDEFRFHHVAVGLVVDKELKSFNDDIDLCLYRIVQAIHYFQRLLETADRTDNSQSINCPPLTSIVSPTTYEEASEARNAITFAHSSGVPIRPSGIVVTKLRIISGVEKT